MGKTIRRKRVRPFFSHTIQCGEESLELVAELNVLCYRLGLSGVKPNGKPYSYMLHSDNMRGLLNASFRKMYRRRDKARQRHALRRSLRSDVEVLPMRKRERAQHHFPW